MDRKKVRIKGGKGMYPRLTVHLAKVRQNLDAVSKITHGGSCSMMIVTKGFCADKKIVELIMKHQGVDFLADSRVQNIKTYAETARKNGKETVLLRLPMGSEADEVVKYVDLSFNSEIATITLLNEAAKKYDKKHKVLLMIDLGDLREGIFFKDEDQIMEAISQILKMEHIELYGVGVNLTCYGAVIPKHDNLSILVSIAKKIEEKFGISLSMVSGGNSSSIYLIGKGEMPEGINNLRLGESFILGNDTAYGTKIEGTCSDALILEAEIIELKRKQSIPIGETGVDAFGQKPVYEDRGVIKRAILAVGKQDIDIDSLTPLDKKIDILGGSSDHLILDVTNSDTVYKVGDCIKFELGYGGMLKAFTSAYVDISYEE